MRSENICQKVYDLCNDQMEEFRESSSSLKELLKKRIDTDMLVGGGQNQKPCQGRIYRILQTLFIKDFKSIMLEIVIKS